MKKLRSILLILFFVAPALAQERPVPIATTSTPGKVKPDGVTVTVDADGTIHNVGSATSGIQMLNGFGTNTSILTPTFTGGFSTGTTNTNAVIFSSKFLPRVITGTGLLCPVGNSQNLFTNTLSYGCTNLHVGDNIVYWNGAVGAQYEICEVVDAATIRVFELILTNTAAGGGQIIASNSWYQVYLNSANLWDVNGEQNDYAGHENSAIASDGGFIAAAGPFKTGWSYGYRWMGATNNARVTLSVLGTRGPVMDFEAGGNGQQTDPFYWSLWAPYESLGIMSNGWIAVRSGIFTNNFAPLLYHATTTNQFGDGVQAILRGPDSNFQFVLREGGNRWNNYYSFGDTYSAGGGHRFTTRGGGGDKTEFVIGSDLIYHGVPLMLETTNAIVFAALGANQLVLINTNGVLLDATLSGTNAVYLAGTATSYGLGSSSQNATLPVGTAGITNTLTINYRLLGFTGTSVTQTNVATHTTFSRGTITTPIDIVLQPNEALRGSSCAAQSVQAL